MSIKSVSIALIVLLAGCHEIPILPGITPYRIDIQQGNAVDQEMISKLRRGMTMSQVRYALGTPLLMDAFHSDRWDYFYSLRKGGVIVESRRFVVFFKAGKLDRIEGDVVASLDLPVGDQVPSDANIIKPPAKPALPPVSSSPTPAESKKVTPTPVPTPVSTGTTAPSSGGKPATPPSLWSRILNKIGL